MMLQAAEAAPRLRAQLVDGARERVLQLALDPVIALLLRVEFRRVRREPGSTEVGRVRGEECLHDAGPVGVQAIPDEQERPPHAAAEVGQREEDLAPGDRAAEVPRRAGRGRRRAAQSRARCWRPRGACSRAAAPAARPPAPTWCLPGPETCDPSRPRRQRRTRGGELFFQPGPIAPEPRRDEGLVALGGPRDRVLGAEAVGVEQPP